MIKIRYAIPQSETIKFPEEKAQAHLFQRKLFPGDDWESPFYRSLVEAEGVDAVLLVAGARSTLIAGQISVARPLPVLAIEKFGGSAAIIHKELAVLEPLHQGYPACDTHTPAQMVKWLNDKCAVRAQEQAERQKMEANYQKRQTEKTVWAISAFIVLLLILFYGLSKSPDPGNYPFLMVAGLAAAGAMGALLRSIIWGPDEAKPLVSLLLGAVAGFFVGVAYMVPQFISGPVVTTLADGTSQVPWTSKVQFISAVLIGFSAGVGSDTVLTKIRAARHQINVELPGGKK